MPKQEEHIKKAKTNEEFGDYVLENAVQYNYWAVVAYHYSALHWVEAYIEKVFRKHCTTHNAREDYISRDSNLRTIYNEYHQLSTDSLNARYKIVRFVDADFTVIKSYLEKIKNKINSHL